MHTYVIYSKKQNRVLMVTDLLVSRKPLVCCTVF